MVNDGFSMPTTDYRYKAVNGFEDDFIASESCFGDYEVSGKVAPRLPRISFTEAPPDLMELDIDSLPPMDPIAVPSTYRYCLRLLLESDETFPRVAGLRPSRSAEGRLQLSPMRDRPNNVPVRPGTPTRGESLLALRHSCSVTAAFLERTQLNVPPECDPEVQSRRGSNLSQSDIEEDLEFAAHIPPAPVGGAEALAAALEALERRQEQETGQETGGAKCSGTGEAGEWGCDPKGVSEGGSFGGGMGEKSFMSWFAASAVGVVAVGGLCVKMFFSRRG